MDPNWKKWAKDQLKGNKKMLLSGTAYLKLETSGLNTLMITPQKGTAKLDKIAKQAKGLLKRAKVQLALATPTPNEEPQEVSSSSQETTDNTNAPKQALTTAQKTQMDTNVQKFKEHISKLKSQLKIA